MTCRTLAVALGVVCLVAAAGVPVLADPVIPDYTFKLVDSKPGVIPGFNLAYSEHMGITNPNPLDTGAGVGHEYLAVYCKHSSWSQRILFLHRNDVTPYDDFQGKN